ncbi:MAG: 50S ribosomal protein L30 [Spirochaetaceae bacterium]|jgi:large subunit ribosomal protein L30|nr:50S ribosomal protein L30 [Spirochaetaceae bacterium]
MAKIKVKLVRSTIACLPKQRATVRALGLRKISSERVHDDNPVIRGMIRVVEHLVKVEEAK